DALQPFKLRLELPGQRDEATVLQRNEAPVCFPHATEQALHVTHEVPPAPPIWNQSRAGLSLSVMAAAVTGSPTRSFSPSGHSTKTGCGHRLTSSRNSRADPISPRSHSLPWALLRCKVGRAARIES